MRQHTEFVRVVLFVLALLAIGSTASAQEITGGLTGSVKDPQGAAIKGATVTIIETAKKQVARTLTTNDDGVYTAGDLHVGVYDVTVEATGCKKHIETKVQVDVGK